ncbi:MAG: 2-oxoacid:acceptor oxidoreductase family protein [Desulfitobacteriaceae bacterium]
MSEKQWQIVLAGTGGQGLILAGVVLAKAGILEGNHVVQTQSYGTQSRGGYSQAEVLLSKGEIYFPKCAKPDLVLALSQMAYDRYKSQVGEDCILLFDQESVQSSGRAQDVGFPFTSTALELGNERVINSLALGAMIRLCPVVEPKNILRELEGELPSKVWALNLEAFNLGYERTVDNR